MESPRLNFENLVFRGGGVKGLAYCGALREMDERGMLANVRRYAGSSAGAITATLLAVGYKPSELEQEMRVADFCKFKDKDNILKSAEKFFKNYGFYKGEYFYQWIGQMLWKKVHNADITFQEVFQLCGKELILTGTCLTHLEVHYFGVHSTPDMKVRDALRISMSIPLFFEPVRMDPHLFVDGGVGDNFPLHIFDGEGPDSDSCRRGSENMQTLGFCLLEDKHRITQEAPRKISNVKDFMGCLLDTFKGRISELSSKPEDKKRTVEIYTHYISTTTFSITKEEKDLLLHEGKAAVKKFFHLSNEPDGATATRGQLVVKLLKAEALKAGDSVKFSSSPFCVMHLDKETKKSSVKNVTTNPTWNENFIFKAHRDDVLNIQVLHSHTFRSKNGYLGEVNVDLSALPDSESTLFQLPLKDGAQNNTGGTLHFSLLFSPEC